VILREAPLRDGSGRRGRGAAGGSVTRSPDSALFERRTGLGGPTSLARRPAPPAPPVRERRITHAPRIPKSRLGART